MHLIYATGNSGKAHGLRSLLEPEGIVVEQVPLELTEPQDSLENITRAKALEAYERLGQPVVVMDSGLSLDAYPGWPGAFVKHDFAGLGESGFLRLVEGKSRRGRFEHWMGYMSENLDEPHLLCAADSGRLATVPRGNIEDKPWLYSGIARLFIPDGQEKTHAEMSRQEFRAWKDSLPREQNHNAVFADWYLQHVWITRPQR